MPRVRTPDGRVIDVAPSALAYYRRELGYDVLGSTETPAMVTVDVNDVESGQGDGAAAPERFASKREWYDYAAATDPDIADYENITQEELVKKYGGG